MTPAREARVGLMPRTGGEDDIVWCPVAPGYAFHVANAHGVAVSVVLIVTLPVPIYLVAGPALWTAAYRRRRVAAPNH